MVIDLSKQGETIREIVERTGFSEKSVGKIRADYTTSGGIIKNNYKKLQGTDKEDLQSIIAFIKQEKPVAEVVAQTGFSSHSIRQVKALFVKYGEVEAWPKSDDLPVREA